MTIQNSNLKVMSSLFDKLVIVQSELKAPKSKTNNFAKYKYRSCEDILEAVKPLLREQGIVLIISDEIVQIGDRYYVKATASVTSDAVNKELAINTPKFNSISVTAYAREPLEKKGSDESQITGAASSYARKYALNGLFLIDDTQDADTMDNTAPKNDSRKLPPPASAFKPAFSQHGSSAPVDASPQMIKDAEDLCKELGKDPKKMWAGYGITGKPTVDQVSQILTQLKLAKKSLAKEIDAKASKA